MTDHSTIGWTIDFLDWNPWVETVDETGISSAQRAKVDETLGSRAGSIYYETLANDLDSVRTRTVLFSDIFEGEGGTPRADRELAATATSRANGCVYCASVHARLYGNLSKQRDLVQRLLDDGVDAELPAREGAIVEFSRRLTENPESLSATDVEVLHAQGFDHLGILDIIQSAAIFANANRLMLTLGEPARKAS